MFVMIAFLIGNIETTKWSAFGFLFQSLHFINRFRFKLPLRHGHEEEWKKLRIVEAKKWVGRGWASFMPNRALAIIRLCSARHAFACVLWIFWYFIHIDRLCVNNQIKHTHREHQRNQLIEFEVATIRSEQRHYCFLGCLLGYNRKSNRSHCLYICVCLLNANIFSVPPKTREAHVLDGF